MTCFNYQINFWLPSSFFLFLLFAFGLRRGFVIRLWETGKVRRHHVVPCILHDPRSSFWTSARSTIIKEGAISAAQFGCIKGMIALKCFQEATSMQDRTAWRREGMTHPFLNTLWETSRATWVIGAERQSNVDYSTNRFSPLFCGGCF